MAEDRDLDVPAFLLLASGSETGMLEYDADLHTPVNIFSFAQHCLMFINLYVWDMQFDVCHCSVVFTV